jgi:hypothetical protein
MTSGADSAVAPAPGWYPDPSSPGGLRWWSGAAWTEHVSAPVPPAADEVPDLARFSRDPGTRATREEPAPAVHRDPYRDRNVIAGAALGVALLSIPGTIADVFLDLDPFLGYLIGGVPIALAILGLVASIRLGVSTRMAWLALAISAVTMAAGWALSAQQFESELHVPTVTDVPGITEIQQLQDDAG